MNDQQQKAAALALLHARPGAFIIPNAWDAGSARLLEIAGFEAIATTSAGFAFSLGQQDNHSGRDAILRNAAEIAAATKLPVSADLENAFGVSAEAVAETMRLAGAAGLVGGSIEDSTRDAGAPLLAMEHAAELVRAAAEAAHALPHAFALTARAENFLVGRLDLADVIRRLQAYQEAGADVLYAPGLTREADIRTLVSSVDRPVNVVMGLAAAPFSVGQLAAMGVRRISVGSALARRAYSALIGAAREMREDGTFGFAQDAASHARFTELFAR